MGCFSVCVWVFKIGQKVEGGTLGVDGKMRPGEVTSKLLHPLVFKRHGLHGRAAVLN